VITVLPVTENKNTSKWDEKFGLVEYLDRSGVEAVCAADVETLKYDYEARQLDRGTYARITFLPTFALACWHFGTEEYVGKIAVGRSPEIKGARIDNIALYWTHDFNERKLVILRFALLKPASKRTSDDIVALLMAVEKEAKGWGFGRIVAWNPLEDMIDAAQALAKDGAEVYDRKEDSIPSLRWRGGEKGLTEWYPNEKYTRC
jgi:hypothetical protein